MTESHSQLETSTEEATGESSSVDTEKIQQATKLILEAVGEEPNEGALEDTWQRRVPAVFETLTEGSRDEAKPTLRTFEATNDELVIKTGVPVYSLCEHHLLPYYGVAHVAYRPNDEVVGLSKLPRYVRWQARQLTMQEELTRDIATGLADELDASSVLVQVSATHLCEAMRGIETPTETTTQATVGEPSESDKQQFRMAIQNHD
jgi:GTP cyclohydrolase I